MAHFPNFNRNILMNMNVILLGCDVYDAAHCPDRTGCHSTGKVRTYECVYKCVRECVCMYVFVRAE